MALSRDKIVKHAGMMKTQEVHVPAWADENGDDVVIVRGLTSREWDTHQAAVTAAREANDGNESNASAQLVSRCVVDPAGARVFSDGDAGIIGELSVADINRIGEAIIELSGLSEEARKSVQKNSEAAPSGSSDSDSPAT